MKEERIWSAKCQVNTIHFSSLGFSTLYLMIEAKNVILSYVFVHVYRGNIYANYIVNGGEKDTQKEIRFLFFTQTGQGKHLVTNYACIM